jgi:hypothetical protein
MAQPASWVEPYNFDKVAPPIDILKQGYHKDKNKGLTKKKPIIFDIKIRRGPLAGCAIGAGVGPEKFSNGTLHLLKFCINGFL